MSDSITEPKWSLTLFVGGRSPQSLRAIKNLNDMVDKHMGDHKPDIVVLDVLEKPEVVRSENILALPTLQRVFPEPRARIIGDLSDTTQVWSALRDV